MKEFDAAEVEYYLNDKLNSVLGNRATLWFGFGDISGCYGLRLTVY